MAWFSGKVSLGNFPDLSGAVNKLSESVKNIEKTFDSALGLEGNSDAVASDDEEKSGLWPSTEGETLFEPIMGLVTQKSGEKAESTGKGSSSNDEKSKNEDIVNERDPPKEEANEELRNSDVAVPKDETVKEISDDSGDNTATDGSGAKAVPRSIPVSESEQKDDIIKTEASNLHEKDLLENASPTLLEPKQTEPIENNPDDTRSEEVSSQNLESIKPESITVEPDKSRSEIDGSTSISDYLETENANKESLKEVFPDPDEVPEAPERHIESSAPDAQVEGRVDKDIASEMLLPVSKNSVVEVKEAVSVMPPSDTFTEPLESKRSLEEDSNIGGQRVSTGNHTSDTDSVAELDKLRKEMKMMETALQGAARQAQAKADEIAKLMNENEQFKSTIDDLRKKTTEADIESLREEFHQKVAALERKVYALTKERDTLRREQNKKSDAAALLKEKDEIITQVMAEGEQLSKKQAAQESQMRKLRAQIRELEEEKKGLLTRIQVEESKVDSIKRDKATTEKLLQETVEKHQAELAAQKEYFVNALNAAKEAEALAEARADTEARTKLESRLREVQDREGMLVQTLEELRQTLSRKEQQAAFREDTLLKDIEDLQKRCQASELRFEELITKVPESTRPLLRQIEAIQETTARKAEAWAAVERTLNLRLQEAEARAAAAEEKERYYNERMTQTLSRINVLEAQISCLRAEQTQLTKSLEKERQRAAENRQEYLVLKEEAETYESRAIQLENEIKELRRKHKEELHEMRMNQEQLQKELEREKAARSEKEMAVHVQPPALLDSSPISRQISISSENGSVAQKTPTARSLSSMEESYFLKTTLDPSEKSSGFRTEDEAVLSSYYIKSLTSNTFEAALRQKDGELASYSSRLASLESVRDSLSEELVKLTAECERLRTEATLLPGIRAELDALRRRHSAALELMGERDEELEELRNDIVDLKEMYKEQVSLLVNKIQTLNSSS